MLCKTFREKFPNETQQCLLPSHYSAEVHTDFFPFLKNFFPEKPLAFRRDSWILFSWLRNNHYRNTKYSTICLTK